MMQQLMSIAVLCIVIREWFSWQGHGSASLLGCSIMLNGKYLRTVGVRMLHQLGNTA